MKKIACTLIAELKEFEKDSRKVSYFDYTLVLKDGTKVSVQPKEWDKKTLRVLVQYLPDEK